MIKKITLILFIILSILAFNKINVEAKTKETKNLVNIYFFNSNTCSHCKEENEFLSEINEDYNNIKIYKYEIHESYSRQILKQVEDLYHQKINSVPLTIIGNKVYTGFSERNKLEFRKTIEYYSKYGYEDYLGKSLNIELPTYNINKENISLNEFKETYHNYNIFGLKTDNIESSTIAILLGLSDSLHILSILGIVLLALITYKIKIQKNKLISQLFYIITFNIFMFNNILENKIISFCTYLIIIFILMYLIIKKIRKKKQYHLFILAITIPIIINFITKTLKTQNITILKNIAGLHKLKGLNKIQYYTNYILINFIMIIIMLYFIPILIDIINKKIIKKNQDLHKN